MTQRVATGVLLAAGGLFAAQWPQSFALVVLAVALFSLWEFGTMIARRGSPMETPVALVAVVLYLGLTYAGTIQRYESDLLAATLIAALVFASFTGKGNNLARSGLTLLAVLYVGKLTSYFIAIRDIPGIGLALTIAAIAIVVATDTFAMIVGRAIGRTPLSALSPKKTVEGAIGGFIAGCAAGAVAFMALPALATLQLHWWQGLLIGALTSVAAQAGDLVESAIKRDARVKDAGNALGGHGGVLDRFDSFLFGGIVFYFSLWLAGFAVPGLHELMHAGRLE